VLDHVLQHHLVLDLLEFEGVVVVAVLDAVLAAALADLVEVVAVNLQLLERFEEGHRGGYEVLHACGLVGGDALVPPLEGLREVAARQLLVREVARAVRREYLHADGLDVGLELFGRLSVEFAVVVAGGLHGGVAHVGEVFQHLLVVVLVLSETADQVADGVELDGYVFLGGLFGRCGVGREGCDAREQAECHELRFHRSGRFSGSGRRAVSRPECSADGRRLAAAVRGFSRESLRGCCGTRRRRRDPGIRCNPRGCRLRSCSAARMPAATSRG